jgi:hypothetical protein
MSMTAIDIFAWIVFIVIIVSVAVVFVALAQLPGKTARERNHPQADAIEIASWLGLLLTMGVVWVLAMVWARMTPIVATTGNDDVNTLRERIAELESKLAAIGEAQQ